MTHRVSGQAGGSGWGDAATYKDAPEEYEEVWTFGQAKPERVPTGRRCACPSCRPIPPNAVDFKLLVRKYT